MSSRRGFLKLLGFAAAAPVLPTNVEAPAPIADVPPEEWWNARAEPPEWKKIFDETPKAYEEAPVPAYSFSSDTDTGIYRVGADRIGFVVGGVRKL